MLKYKFDNRLYVTTVIYIFFTIFICFVLRNIINIEQYSHMLGFFTVTHFFLAMVLMYLTDNLKLSFSTIFIILIYVFHTGQTIILTFFKKYTFLKFNLLQYVGTQMYVETYIFVIPVLTAIVLGICFAKIFTFDRKKVFNELSPKESKELNKNIDELKCRKIGIIILIVTFPISFIIAVNRIRLTLSGNYFDSFNYNISGYVSFLNDFLIVGITLLILSYWYSKRKVTLIYFISIFYYCCTMLSGGRGKAIISIIYLTFLYLKLVKISIKTIIIFIIVGYLGLSALSVISVLRDQSNLTVDDVSKYLKNKRSPILNTLEEFGGTEYTVEIVMNEVPTKVNYKYGETYINSLSTILPNVKGVFTELNDSANYVKQLNVSYIGGSIIGELYYNFGNFSFVFALIIGYLVEKISKTLNEKFNAKSYYKIGWYSLVFTTCLWWIRDTFVAVVRNNVWGLVIILLLSYFYDSVVNYKNRVIQEKEYDISN